MVAKAKVPANAIDLSTGSKNTYLVGSTHNLIPRCIHCKEFRPVLLDGDRYFRRFMRGESIDATFPLPMFTLGERELLMTGTHPECWDALFAEDEG